MSGGGIDRAHIKNADQLICDHYDRTLRNVAVRLEEHGGYATRELSDDEVARMTALLRAKADRIESARRSVERAFDSHRLDELLKALDKTITCDTPPETVAEAWREYGMEVDE